jgi:diacylglycerol kinase (ATP)
LRRIGGVNPLNQETAVRIAFIVNAPDPATVAALRTEVSGLREGGHEVSARLTFEGGDAVHFASEAVAAGAELIVAAGGDGTLNEVVNGMMQCVASRSGTEPPRLGLVPLGTANDFAAYLGLPTEIEAAVDTAVSGRARHCDVGRVNDRYFLNVSTAGFGAEATQETPSEVKRALGSVAYLVTGVQKFARLQPSIARFTMDGEFVFEGGFLLFAVGNTTLTGGGNRLTPEARIDDGLLDVCVVRDMARAELVRLLPELRAGRHIGHPAVVYRQARSLTVEAAAELSINADGEPMSGRAFHYRLADRHIMVMAPDTAADG